jgi:hypothetical protein
MVVSVCLLFLHRSSFVGLILSWGFTLISAFAMNQASKDNSEGSIEAKYSYPPKKQHSTKEAKISKNEASETSQSSNSINSSQTNNILNPTFVFSTQIKNHA